MDLLLYPFIGLAVLGFGISLLAHGAALLGMGLPDYTMTLHLGIFVVWIPAMIAAYPVTQQVARKDQWKAMLLGCPPGLKYTVYAFFAYAFINFALGMLAPATASAANGASSSSVRLFSGHWMLFYVAAAATMYAALQRKKQGLTLQCPQGHPVSPSARYCEICGEPVSHKRKRQKVSTEEGV